MMTFEEKYDAIGRKDLQYEGLFVTAVKTTGIFCRPSCRARKPKPENCIFYDDARQALQDGFRPCKICKPMEAEGEMPEEYKAILTEVNANPDRKIKDYDLRERNIEPARIRRWFKQHHAMTFQTYQRLLRINTAYNQIKEGEKITPTAFDTAYESLSGFTESYKNIFGYSPSLVLVCNEDAPEPRLQRAY